MARFYGKIGYARSVESKPGVWTADIVEYEAYGDVRRNTRGLQGEDKVNDDIRVNNLISVVMDAYARENFHAIRYVLWSGARWKVSDVEVESPRLLLTLGGVWNGRVPS